MDLPRCPWRALSSSALYQAYHDTEWGVACYDDKALFELLLLESFHCGLSWLTVLRKREAFRKAFAGFDVRRVDAFTAEDVELLLQDASIIRHRAKIEAAITNANCFIAVQAEFGSFAAYIWSFTEGEVLYFPSDGTMSRNDLSDRVAKDLKSRGFRWMGSVTTFSYLEAIGVMNNHAPDCFCFKSAPKR